MRRLMRRRGWGGGEGDWDEVREKWDLVCGCAVSVFN